MHLFTPKKLLENILGEPGLTDMVIFQTLAQPAAETAMHTLT